MRLRGTVVCVLAMSLSLLSGGKIYGKGPGTTGAAFLKIGVGARAVALGESYAAVADEVSTLYWNPAGLSNIAGCEVILQHNQWLSQISQEYLGCALPVGEGKLGIGLNYLHLGEIERTLEDSSGNYAGTDGAFKAGDIAVSIAYSREIVTGLKVGLGIKGIEQRIDSEIARGIAVDLGGYYQTAVKGLSVGLVAQNLGPKIKFIEQADPLPFKVKIGSALKIKGNLLMSLDINKPIDNKVGINAGVEYTVFKVLSMRVGYNSRQDLDKGLTYGAGFNLGKISLDYVFVPYGDLGDTHRVSMSIQLP